mmetsp:Transcript_67369/g.170520  ORF Transcript_67369/g.170520 Transcript_67369/m.170520 type:complete len:429 (+) Transcript_67369:1-1287(+)
MSPAPPLNTLLEAAEGRSLELDSESETLRDELAALEKEVVDKRAEKTIAAQKAVQELLKKKETLQKKSKLMDAAAGHVRLALAKLKRAQAAGLDDWKELKEEKLKLSDFAADRLKDKAEVTRLEAAACGASLKIEGSALTFNGSSKGFDALKSALEQLESAYSCDVEVEAVTLRLLDIRGGLQRLEKKHSVSLTADSGAGLVRISGSAEQARKAEKDLKWRLTGKEDLPCPKELNSASRRHAKDIIEVETGAFVEVARGDFGGDLVMHIRGDQEGVQEAKDQLQTWIEERGFVTTKPLANLDQAKWQQFTDDMWHFGEKFDQQFGVKTAVSDSGSWVRLRDPSAKNWEAEGFAAAGWWDTVRGELKQVMDWYSSQAEEEAKAEAKAKVEAEAKAKAKAKAQAKAKAKAAEDDAWGAAPEADITLGHRW